MNTYSVALVLVAVTVHVSAPDVHYIPNTWVDPTDMRYYDRYSKSMKFEERPPEEYPVIDEKCPSSNPNQQSVLSEEVKRYEIFLERFINRFLLVARLKEKELKPQTRITTEIPILITSEELARLKLLSKRIGSSRLNELDAIFSAVLNHERGFSFDSLTPYLNPVQQLFTDISWEKITIVIFVVVSGIVLWMFAVGREYKRILIFLYLIFFMSGLAWNWWYLYQEAVVEQYAAMKKLSHIPDTCAPKILSFFGYFFSPSNDHHDCEKYHKAFRINPFSKVPPSIVLSETISGMLIHPLKSIGCGIGELLIGINRAASWPLNIIFLPFVFIALLAFVFCVLLICFGRKLNMWTLLGGISIGDRAAAPVDEEKKSAMAKIIDEKDLKQFLDYETEHTFVLTQVGAIRKYVENDSKVGSALFARPLSSTTTLKWGQGDVEFLSTGSARNKDIGRDCTSSESDIKQQSKEMLQLFSYIPKKKFPSFKTLSQKGGIRKRYK